MLGDEVSQQVPPAKAGLEQVKLGAEIIDQPLALARDSLLGLLRSGLVVRADDLDMQREFVHRDRAGYRSERLGWSACGPHLHIASQPAFYRLRVPLPTVF